MNTTHKKLMPMTAIGIIKIHHHTFTHGLEITSMGHTFQGQFEFPEGDVWVERVPLSVKHFKLKMRIGDFEHTATFEDELGHFAQCVSESMHFFMKLRRGNFVYLLRTMMECMVYFGKVYGRIVVDEYKTIRPAKEN
jgi:hypothetical protein